ncbi:hypothetical protein FRC11_008960, partial [Ceratobasidium sp. 423]
MFNSTKHSGSYIGSRRSHSALPSSTSDSVAMLGCRDAPSSIEGLRRATVIPPPKKQKLTWNKLAAVQDKDSKNDKKLMQQQMSAAEMAKFAEFQQDFLDGLESGGCASSNDDPVSNPLDGEAHESDWEDEDEAIITGLGLKSKNTDWARRLANIPGSQAFSKWKWAVISLFEIGGEMA